MTQKQAKSTIFLTKNDGERNEKKLETEQLELILGISVSQIERLRAQFRIKCQRKQDSRRGRSVSVVKSQIEVRAERWNVNEPRWLEADCVAPCGGNMGGAFIWQMCGADGKKYASLSSQEPVLFSYQPHITIPLGGWHTSSPSFRDFFDAVQKMD